jgi:hypothetical protein
MTIAARVTAWNIEWLDKLLAGLNDGSASEAQRQSPTIGGQKISDKSVTLWDMQKPFKLHATEGSFARK